MTLGELAEEVAVELGEQYTDSDIAAQYLKWAQQTYEEIVGDGRWVMRNATQGFLTTESVSEYELDSTVSEIRTLYRVPYIFESFAPREIAYLAVESLVARLVERGLDINAQGAPQFWHYAAPATNGNHRITLYPEPDTIYSIRAEVVTKPEILTSTSTIPLPADFNGVLKDGVRKRALMNDKDVEGAKAYHTMFADGLRLLRMRFTLPDRGGSRLRAKRRPAARQSPGTPQEG
jgi:hypothetical protein